VQLGRAGALPLRTVRGGPVARSTFRPGAVDEVRSPG